MQAHCQVRVQVDEEWHPGGGAVRGVHRLREEGSPSLRSSLREYLARVSLSIFTQINQIFIMISYSLLFSRFKCEGCHKAAGSSRKENRFTAKRLQTTRLGNYIETRVNNFLRKKEADAGDVHIRVVFSGDKQVEVKPGMKHRLEKSHFKRNTDFLCYTSNISNI